MSSPENTLPLPENQKTRPQKPPQVEQPQKCPRCDSSNTKFCYYNNYSLTQPRHFCKTCRRYWTQGGALRNVSIGGGCRKTTKKLKTTITSTTSSKLIFGPEFGPGFKLGPAQFITSSGCGPGGGPYCGLDLMGLSHCSSLPLGGNDEHQSSISSIESLSSINQEMHWKLQHQRLAMIYETTSLHNDEVNNIDDDQEKSTQGGINLFNNNKNNSNNSDLSRKIDVGPTEWLINQTEQASYGGNDVRSINMVVNNTTNSSCDNGNEVAGSNMHGVWGDLLNHNLNDHHQQRNRFSSMGCGRG